MRISLGKVAVVLALLTVAVIVAMVYTFPVSEPENLLEPRTGLAILAIEVYQAPSYGVVITDPHPYLVEAVENVEEVIYVGVRSEETEALYEQVLERSTYLEYEGKYYGILGEYVDFGLEPSIWQWVVLGFFGLGVCWVAVAYAYLRRAKS